MGTPRRVLALTLCVALLSTAPLGTASRVGSSELQQPNDVDTTVTRIEVHPDGSATWTVEIRTRLDTDERVEEFNAFQDQFRANRSQYLGQFQNRMQHVVNEAAGSTDREMAAVAFDAHTEVQEYPRQWGVVTYEFQWNGFAQVEDDDIVVGDTFEGGLYLAEGDVLEIVAPDGYTVAGTEPEPVTAEADSVVWVGVHDFSNEEPHVRFTPEESTSTIGSHWLAGGVMLTGAVGTAVYVLRRRKRNGGEQPENGIVTDEEHVIALLREHDGRIRQAAIVEELDWSASKASRVVASLVDDGRVEKLRLGRENVIDLRDN